MLAAVRAAGDDAAVVMPGESAAMRSGNGWRLVLEREHEGESFDSELRRRVSSQVAIRLVGPRTT